MMTDKQKFKRGNRVRFKELGPVEVPSPTGVGTYVNMMAHHSGQEAIIIGSYADQCGCGETDKYTVIFPDEGDKVSWVKENELIFIEDGGEHLIVAGEKKRKEIEKQDKDLDYILPRLDDGKFSGTTMLYLFELLGFKSSFECNGEYTTLFNDWDYYHQAFTHIKNAKTMEDAKSIFTPKGLSLFNIEEVYKLFHGLECDLPERIEKEKERIEDAKEKFGKMISGITGEDNLVVVSKKRWDGLFTKIHYDVLFKHFVTIVEPPVMLWIFDDGGNHPLRMPCLFEQMKYDDEIVYYVNRKYIN